MKLAQAYYVDSLLTVNMPLSKASQPNDWLEFKHGEVGMSPMGKYGMLFADYSPRKSLLPLFHQHQHVIGIRYCIYFVPEYGKTERVNFEHYWPVDAYHVPYFDPRPMLTAFLTRRIFQRQTIIQFQD